MDDKIRENRLRRMAARQGLALHKSRRRDPRAIDYGRYWFVLAEGAKHYSRALVPSPAQGLTIDEVERLLTGEEAEGDGTS
jgi:hypothetical protein